MTPSDDTLAMHAPGSGLRWVGAQLNENLRRAAQLVERHWESPREAEALEQALAQLHELRGAAVLVQAYGLALLVEEMKQTLQDLIASRVHELDPAYSALVSACVQAGDYVDLLLQDQADSVLVLQPIINELRLARGKSLLTEDDLFVAQFRVLGLQLAHTPPPPNAASAQAEAARFAPVFSAALLSWFRDQDGARALSRIGRIAELLAEVSRERALHQLWRTAAACVEALLSRTLEESLELKRQFGRAGQLLKILAEADEASAVRQMSDVSLRLLFYAGRSRGQGARIGTLRRALQLDTWLPGVEAVQAARARLRGANTGLLSKVADELRADLAEVRDSIDVALRTGATQTDFDTTAERLKRVADTLLVLGLPAESQALAQPVETLREAEDGAQAGTEAWMEFATAVMQVELSLDTALYRQLRTPKRAEAAARPIADLREGTHALLRESLVNIARIKGYVEDYIKSENVLGLPEAVRLLDEVAAGFRILDLGQAEDLVLEMQQFMQAPEFASVRMSNTVAGRFADAIAAVEYYLELRRDNAAGAESVLDQLDAIVSRLREKPPEAVAEASAETPARSVAEPAPSVEFALAPVLAEPAPSPAPRDVDPEIRQVFLDEAGEVLRTLQAALPAWRRQPEDFEALGTIRRAFHTLKGSGRMVAAADIAELARAVEHMLNKLLDRTLEPGAAQVDTVRQTVDLLPEMIAAFRDGRAQPAQAPQLTERATQLAVAPATPQADLLAVFRADAATRVTVVGEWLAAQLPTVPAVVPEPVVRAFHTLRGSALSVGARGVGELAAALEDWLEAVHVSGGVLDESARALLADACTALRAGIAGTPGVDTAALLERIAAQRGGAPAQQMEDRQIAEVFALEALELVQRFEADLSAWVRAPAAPGQARVLKAHMHRLKGAAAAVQCAPLADLAQALNLKLGAVPDAVVADAAFLSGLQALVPLLYAQLDAYREGRAAPDAADAPARVAAFQLQAPSRSEAAPRAPLGADAEVIDTFLQEAEELLEDLDHHAETLSLQPQDAHALGGWQRALHTLKGSARVAGQPDIGEVAHWLETATEESIAGGAPAQSAFRARVRVALDGLHRLVDSLRTRGHAEGFDDLRARYEALTRPAPVVDAAPQIVAPEPEPAPEPLPEPFAPDDEIDPELLALFEPEAVELLESLHETLGAWQMLPYQSQLPREMQRDLHTFKGGARLAGLSSLGQAAHALESELSRLERQGADGESITRIGAQLDELQARFDRVRRAPPPASPEPASEPATEAVTEADAAETETLSFALDVPEPASGWNPLLRWSPEDEEPAQSDARRETVRVPVERLDSMLNQAGEISIFRSRLEENHTALTGALSEMAQTIARVREQLRLLDIETEAQIAARGFARGGDEHRYESQFDPLEMDRYSRMQELSRVLAESLSDLASLHASLDTAGVEAEGLLQQQGRINTEVQQGLMSTLMVPFSRQVQRLARVVRQTAEQNGRQARIDFAGAESELDRNVLERMSAPLEHLLRNSVVHGIESPSERIAAGKSPEGQVHVGLRREGSQLSIEVRDDGRGLDFPAIRAEAVRRGLMRADAQAGEESLARFVFEPGFSTAARLTQDAGRGIGLDVVAAEVKQLGGSVDVSSEPGRGVRFRIRLPLMLAVSQALVVQVGEELFAIPLGAVEGITRVAREQLADLLRDDGTPLNYGGQPYPGVRLGDLVGIAPAARADSRSVPAILMRVGDGLSGAGRRVAVIADRLIGNREIVTKPVGPVLGSVPGISGATILADGRVMLIVDVAALMQESTRRRLGSEAGVLPLAAPDTRPLILVVDDSITIRRVTERLLTRKGYRVITAKDGLDAMALLQTESPEAVLLDIEMPRADGFEVAAFIRNTPRTASLPIIIITSRSGDKHREHARQLGVNRYLIKPYQEDQLLDELRQLLGAHDAQPA